MTKGHSDKLRKFEKKDISPSKDVSAIPDQLNPHHHRCNNIIRTRINVARYTWNLPRACSLCPVFLKNFTFYPLGLP